MAYVYLNVNKINRLDYFLSWKTFSETLKNSLHRTGEFLSCFAGHGGTVEITRIILITYYLTCDPGFKVLSKVATLKTWLSDAARIIPCES